MIRFFSFFWHGPGGVVPVEFGMAILAHNQISVAIIVAIHFQLFASGGAAPGMCQECFTTRNRKAHGSQKTTSSTSLHVVAPMDVLMNPHGIGYDRIMMATKDRSKTQSLKI